MAMSQPISNQASELARLGNKRHSSKATNVSSIYIRRSCTSIFWCLLISEDSIILLLILSLAAIYNLLMIYNFMAILILMIFLLYSAFIFWYDDKYVMIYRDPVTVNLFSKRNVRNQLLYYQILL